MSPSFRDLKGREVEDVVDSRTFPTQPTPGANVPEMIERGEIKAAMEKAAANRPRRERSAGDQLRDRVLHVPESETPGSLREPLPEDIETALAAIETTATDLHITVTDGVRTLHEQIAALRARAQQDADKVAKFSAALKLLQQADEQ
jgi:hypothetical protein